MKMHWMHNYWARHWRGIAIGASTLSLLAASACTVTTDNSAGRLIVDWTIDDGKDPSLCTVSGATDIDIIVDTPSGAHVNEFLAPCTDFSTKISTLARGDYVANAVLVDGSGAERTTEIPISQFTMTSDDLVIPIDFPANSFR